MSSKISPKVKESWYIFSIVMLSILLALSLFLFLQNPFVTNQPTRPTLLPVGTPCNIVVGSGESASQVLFFHGSLLPEFNVRQDVNITLKSTAFESVARAKVFMFDDENKILPLAATPASQWVLGEDGYFYSNENLTANLTVDFLEFFKTPPADKNLNSEALYSMIITVETLPVSAPYADIWQVSETVFL